MSKGSLYSDAAGIPAGIGLGVGGAALGTIGLGVSARKFMKTRGVTGVPNLQKISKGGAITAAIGGGMILGGINTLSSGISSVSQNPFNASYYNNANQSSLTAQRLHASGDIVLGAHNTRRGF